MIIDAPHFYAGIVIRDGVAVGGAPILNWTRGKERDWLQGYFKRKGYDVTEFPDESELEGIDRSPQHWWKT